MKHVKKENTLLDKAITQEGMQTPTEQLNDLFEYFGTIFSPQNNK